MRDDDLSERDNERAGSADRKTRRDGNRVIHTPNGALFHGEEDDRPRGLTAEQDVNQREGWKLDERQARELAQEAKDAPPHHVRNATDELASPPFGRKGEKTK